MRFPGVEFTEQAAVVTPYSSGNAVMWSGSVGQISAAFFKHFVVDINFDSMQITLIEPDNFQYGGAGVEIPWEPRGDGPQMIPANMRLADGRDVQMKVLMDLGYNDQLLLAIGGENDIAVPEKKQPASLGFNIHREETRGYIGRLPRIDIGGFVIDKPIVSYVSEDCTDHTVSEAMIGLGLLSRFNLTFDYYRQRMFIEPNGSFNNPFEHDMTGMTLGRGANGSAEISSVYDNSPASEAGLLEDQSASAACRTAAGSALSRYQAKMSPTAACPDSYPWSPGRMPSRTSPAKPSKNRASRLSAM